MLDHVYLYLSLMQYPIAYISKLLTMVPSYYKWKFYFVSLSYAQGGSQNALHNACYFKIFF